MKKIIYMLSALLALTSLCSCSTPVKEAQKTVYAMGTVMELRAYGKNADAALSAAEDEITRLDALLSRGFVNSEISEINKNGGGEVSADTKAILQKGIKVSDKTDGAFDMCIAPLVDLWGFYSKEYHVPASAEIAEILPKTDYNNLIFGGESVNLKNGAELDTGGIAKGYLSNRVIDIFKENGVDSAIISLGGNVQTLGKKADGSLWRVGIRDPEGGLLGTLEALDKAVITSGGYQRFFEEDGKTYHHIIDPQTGMPAESGLVSVTIISSDGAKADALSTAVFVLGKDKGVTLWKNEGDFDMVLMTDEGNIFITEGIKDTFQSDYDFSLITKE
ncbi:MAG: FAD:protein FMN transferase [Clostridia bacterium]|nr:FAD:protein FMN transferase [Clostridia bacterium]